MVWFRKGLRVHDNPALDAARRYGAGAASARLYPVFVLDPRYLRPDPAAASPGSARAGVARIRFLLESLSDLDARLRRLGSRLLLLRARDDVADAVCTALKDVSIFFFFSFLLSTVGFGYTMMKSWVHFTSPFVHLRSSGTSASCASSPILSRTRWPATRKSR